jgi:hypothetical protein
MMCTHFAVLISLSVTVKIIQSVICLFAPHITDHYQVPYYLVHIPPMVPIPKLGWILHGGESAVLAFIYVG